MAYKIRDWDKHFENAKSRTIKNAAHVLMPNSHDGMIFTEIADQKNAIDIFCGWVLIVQLASKMPERGILKNKYRDLTTKDMANMTKFPEKVFKAAIEYLSGTWIEVEDTLGE